jgi:hypothetical protein
VIKLPTTHFLLNAESKKNPLALAMGSRQCNRFLICRGSFCLGILWEAMFDEVKQNSVLLDVVITSSFYWRCIGYLPNLCVEGI